MSKRGGFHYDDAHVVASCPWRPPCHFPPIDEADDDDDGDYLQQTEVAAGQMAKWGLILGRKLPHSAFWFRPFRDDVNNAISIPVPAAIEVKEQQQQPKGGSPGLPHPSKPPVSRVPWSMCTCDWLLSSVWLPTKESTTNHWKKVTETCFFRPLAGCWSGTVVKGSCRSATKTLECSELKVP